MDREEPPPFVRLAAHPLRWRLLRELAQSDRTVSELTQLVGEAQNLVSYHLRLLRESGLVSARRSSADGRDSFYVLDLATCARELTGAGRALHPALAPSAVSTGTCRARRRSVLFVCTGNSARSQIAEGLLAHLSGGAVDCASAGSHPKSLHPNAVRVMRRRGVDISRHRTKHLDEMRSRRFDVVVTLCDRVREACPDLAVDSTRIHWSVPDPSLAGATEVESYPAFERTATELETRIRFLLPTLSDPEEVPR